MYWQACLSYATLGFLAPTHAIYTKSHRLEACTMQSVASCSAQNVPFQKLDQCCTIVCVQTCMFIYTKEGREGESVHSQWEGEGVSSQWEGEQGARVYLMACSLALLGHRSTDSTKDNKTPPMMPATLVMAGSNSSAQHIAEF